MKMLNQAADLLAQMAPCFATLPRHARTFSVAVFLGLLQYTYADDPAVYHYGRWVPMGPGVGINVQFMAVHPTDPNTVICTSDASGVNLTCDAGRSWVMANRGLVGGGAYARPANRTGDVYYCAGRPNAAVKWDPIDPNYVLSTCWAHLVRGRLKPGSPPGISWEIRGNLPPTFSAYVLDICFDPAPDPANTGEAKLFYLVDGSGRVAFTHDGGHTLTGVARIPFSDKASFRGLQNPILAVDPYSPRNARRLLAACPAETWIAWGIHNQTRPDDPANRPVEPRAFWKWDAPHNPGPMTSGLDPNNPGANGIVLIDGGAPDTCRAVLAADNSREKLGGIYTRANLADAPWVLRFLDAKGRAFFDVKRYTPTSLVVDPSDPNLAYLIGPQHGWHFRAGVYRGFNLFADNPNQSCFDAPLDPCNPDCIRLGHSLTGSLVIDGWCLDLARSDPNTLYASFDSIGVIKSNNVRSPRPSWTILDTQRGSSTEDTWSHRGMMACHIFSVILAPRDPNTFYMGMNDYLGSWKTEDGGRSFRKFLALSWPLSRCSPSVLTYKTANRVNTQWTTWFALAGSSQMAKDPADPNASPNNFWTTTQQSEVVSGIVHPHDPNHAWFVTLKLPQMCSLVLKTTDGGRSLTIVQPDNAYWPWNPRQPGGVDPNDPNTCPLPRVRRYFYQMAADLDRKTLYLAAGAEGVLKSTDAGDSWSVCLNAQDPNILNRLDYDPQAFGWPDPSRSQDPNFPRSPHFLTIGVAPTDPNVIYAATGTAGWFYARNFNTCGYVYRSRDAGRTWTRASALDGASPQNSAFHHADRIKKLVVHPIDPRWVAVAVENLASNEAPAPSRSGVWLSRDGGDSWTKLFPTDRSPYLAANCTSVSFDGTNPNNIYWTVSEQFVLDPRKVPRPGVYLKRGKAEPQMLGDPACDDPMHPDYSIASVVSQYYCLEVHPKTGDLYLGTPAGAFHRPKDR